MLPVVPCDQCGSNIMAITEHNNHRVVMWSTGMKSFFCDYDCQLDWMVAHNAQYANPNAQPDVDAQ